MAAKSKRQQMVDLAVLAPLDWIDERTAAVRATKWFLFRNVPRDISWGQTLGSAALTAFIVQALTGAILAMYYKPSAAIDPVTGKPMAYSSIEAITDDLTLGWLVRGMHRWGRASSSSCSSCTWAACFSSARTGTRASSTGSPAC